jgi:hypothetical protein
MNRMSVEEYRELTGQKQSSKMRNVKTEADGIIFDSAKEARHYLELKILKNRGLIIDFFMQVPFLLQEGYWKGSEWVKPIYYRADFVVLKIGRFSEISIEIHEVKGRWTEVAKVKRKMFEKRYPEYELVII